MAEGFSRSLLKVVIAQICQSLGWQAVQTTPCDLLTDILERYIEKLAETTHRYAEQYNRTEPNLDDISHAFRQLGITIGELEDYTNVVEQIPFAHDLPQFPFPKNNALHHPRAGSSEHRERLIYIPDYLPPLVQFGEDADGLGSPLSGPSGSDLGLGGEAFGMDQISPRTPGRGEKRDRTSMLQEEPSSKRLRINEDGTPQELTAISMTAQGVLTPKREGKLPDATTPPQSRLPASVVTPKSGPSEDKKANNDKAKDENMPPPPATVSTPSKSRPKSPKSPKGGGSDAMAKQLKQSKPNSPKGGSRTAKSPERSRTGNKKSPIRAKSPAKQTSSGDSPPSATTPILTGLLSKTSQNDSAMDDDSDNPSPNGKESKLVPASEESMDASIEAVILRAQHQVREQDKQQIKIENVEIKKEMIKDKEDEKKNEKEKERTVVKLNRLTSVDNIIEAVIQRSQQQFDEEEELQAKLKEQKAAEPPKPIDPYDFFDDDSPAPPPIKEKSPARSPIKKLKKNKEQDKKFKIKKPKIKEEKSESAEVEEKPAINVPVIVETKEPVKVKDKSKKKDKKDKREKHREMKRMKMKKAVNEDKKDSLSQPLPEKPVPLIPKISIKTKDFPKTTLTFSGLDLCQPSHKISTAADNKATTGASKDANPDKVERHHEKAKKKKKDKHKERHKEKHRDKDRQKHRDKDKHKKEKHKDSAKKKKVPTATLR